MSNLPTTETTERDSPAAADYLKQPYARIVLPESDGTFRAEILEFPGCMAVAETAPKALKKLEDVAESWIMAALDQAQNIPSPVEMRGFSGRLVLRLPRSLHRKTARIAQRDGVSLNQFIVSSLAEHVGEHQATVARTATIQFTAIQIHSISGNYPPFFAPLAMVTTTCHSGIPMHEVVTHLSERKFIEVPFMPEVSSHG